jgi:hypothetical protein
MSEKKVKNRTPKKQPPLSDPGWEQWFASSSMDILNKYHPVFVKALNRKVKKEVRAILRNEGLQP